MSLIRTIRPLLPLCIGLAVGGLGATLLRQSLPGAEGSPEERANRLEVELQRAHNRIATLEAADPRGGQRRPGRTFADGARTIVEDIRAGRPVSPDDILRATQPLLRDLSPLFDRMRVKQQQQVIDGMTGELARKYDLTPQQQAALKEWFGQKSAEQAKHWSELLAKDGTRLEDVVKASRDVRLDDGLDAFMVHTLQGDKLAAFQTERMAERAARVQQDADTRVQRLDSIVKLDTAQRDEAFGIVARASRDYDPAMKLEGVAGDIGATPTGDRQAALLAVLRPDQRAAYEAEQQRRRAEAAASMEGLGLTLPANWDMLNDN
ncbi:MAG: hypothetical protein WCJ14_10715 [Verrucomicrobiota bacterium]